MEHNIVIIPTDGSKYSKSSAEVGFEFAKKIDATVHALSVGETDPVHRSSIGGSASQSEAEITETASEWASELATAAETYGLETEVVVRTGTPAEEISAYAGEVDADMIVMGTAGRSGFERTVVGGVTDKVVRTAPVPVVTVRPDGTVDAF